MADPVGIQGKGRAGIFGNAINPLQVTLQYQAGRQKRADMLLDEERKQRDALVDDLRKFNPDKVWEPFFSEVNDYVQTNVRDRFHQLRGQGVPITSIDRDLQARKGDANTLVNKINWLKSQHQEAMDTIDSNDVGKFYKNSQTKRALNDIYFNGRVAKPSSEIDASKIQDVFDNVDNMDLNAVSIEFMKYLPDKVNQKYTQEWGKYGQNYDIQETTTKLGHQKVIGPDGRASTVLDIRTGLPKISMTDEVYLQAMENPYLSKAVEKYAPGNDIQKQKDLLTKLLEGLDPNSVQSRPQMGHRTPDEERRYSAYGSSFRLPIADLEDRDSRLEKIVSENRPELLAGVNDPNSDNQTYYGDALGNPIKAGGKPSTIVMARVATPEGAEEIPWTSLTPDQKMDRLFEQAAKGKIVKNEIMPIGTAEEKRKAKILMSLRLDKMDGKRSIGEEYSNFVEAKYQHQIDKNKTTKSGINWKKAPK